MSSNNPQRTSPRFSSSTSHIPSDTGRSSPTLKRNIIYSSSSQNPNCATSAAEILSQSDLNTLNPNVLHFYLQKLELLYQNLDGRVQKLEQLFNAEINNNQNNNFNNILPAIDNNNNVVGHFEFNPAIIAPSNSSISSSSTNCSIHEPIQKEVSVITIA